MSALIAQHAQWIAILVLFFTGLMVSWSAWLTVKVISCASHHDVERLQDKVLVAVEKLRNEIHADIAQLRKETLAHERRVYDFYRNGGKGG